MMSISAMPKLLAKVDEDMAKHLRALLAMKTKAGYSEVRVGADQVTRAGRAMEALLERTKR